MKKQDQEFELKKLELQMKLSVLQNLQKENKNNNPIQIGTPNNLNQNSNHAPQANIQTPSSFQNKNINTDNSYNRNWNNTPQNPNYLYQNYNQYQPQQLQYQQQMQNIPQQYPQQQQYLPPQYPQQSQYLPPQYQLQQQYQQQPFYNNNGNNYSNNMINMNTSYQNQNNKIPNYNQTYPNYPNGNNIIDNKQLSNSYQGLQNFIQTQIPMPFNNSYGNSQFIKPLNY